MAVVEDLDAPRRCEVVATRAAERFGLDVVNGYVLIEGAGIVAHYWNTDRRGVPIDGLSRGDGRLDIWESSSMSASCR
jgi:hypothetical protein